MLRYFDEVSIKKAAETFKTDPRGFRYGFIGNIFKEDVYAELVKTFPDVKSFKLVDKPSGGGRKRFYTGPVYDANKHLGCACHLGGLPAIWRGVLSEASSKEFKSLLKEVTGVSFNTMCTFGLAYGNEGCMQEAHIDGAMREEQTEKIKSTLATLLYFNTDPDNTSGTCVYENDRQTVTFRAPSMRNGLFFFEQHPEAWHGFPVMSQGKERRLVSLAFSSENEPLDIKTSLVHKLTCAKRMKQMVKSVLR